MKKLLGLVGTITIAGSGISGIVGNAPASEKNEINYLQTNNLENLNRNKRNSDYLKPRISLFGSDSEQKGMIYFDIQNKRIRFRSFNNSTFSTFKNIIIKDKNENIVRIITFNPTDFMSNVLRAHNLLIENNDGLSYEDGFTIEIESSQANTTRFVKNDNNDNVWVWNISEKKWKEKFTIINNKMWEIDAYTKKYFSLYLSWKNNNNIWKNEIGRQIRNNLPNYSVAEKRTWLGNTWNEFLGQNLSLNIILATIKNTIDIDNLKTDITSIKLKINDLENKFNDFKNHSRRLSECSAYSGFIGNVFGWIPVIGDIVESVAGLVSSGCEIANIYV